MSSEFNPNDVGVANGNFFGLPYSVEESNTVIVSVPWDVTTSYCDGTSNGPEAIKDASLQVDLFDEKVPNAWEIKMGTLPTDKNLVKHNKKMRKVASDVIDELSSGKVGDSLKQEIQSVNEASEQINEYGYCVSKEYISSGKSVGFAGGEHSVPLGVINALREKYVDFGF